MRNRFPSKFYVIFWVSEKKELVVVYNKDWHYQFPIFGTLEKPGERDKESELLNIGTLFLSLEEKL